MHLLQHFQMVVQKQYIFKTKITPVQYIDVGLCGYTSQTILLVLDMFCANCGAFDTLCMIFVSFSS